MQIDDEKEPETNFQEKYDELYKAYNDFVDDRNILNSALKEFKDAIEEKLENLKNAIDEDDTETIKDLVEILASLLTDTKKMLLEARVKMMLALIDAKNLGQIGEKDYGILAEKLNALDPLTEEEYKKLFDGAKIRQELLEKLNNVKNETGDEYQRLLSELQGVDLEKIQGDFKEKFLDQIKVAQELFHYKEMNKELTYGYDLSQSRKKNISKSLSMKVMQANNQYRGIELELNAQKNVDEKANENPNMKRLRDDGIWIESSTDRHQKLVQEDRINEMNNKNR